MKVYVGNIDERMTERELEDEFSKFGRLISVWVARKPPGFAFIEFREARDAQDAVRDLDGRKGWRVEISKTSNPPSRGRPRGRDFGTLRCYTCGQYGHFARDCLRSKRDEGARRGGRSLSRSRSPPPRRRYRSPVKSTGYRSLSRSSSPRRR